MKPAKPNFCRSPVPAAGGRQIFHVDKVNTSYHTEFHQILSINVAWIKKRQKVSWKCAYQKLPKIWLSFLAILTEKKKKFGKSIPNDLKRVKNMKPAKPNFCRSPVPAAGSRQIFHVDNVNTRYHTEFHQILSINVACAPKRHSFSKG